MGNAAPALAAERHLYGLARTGRLHVALPIGHVREVVPCPATLTAMPATRPDLLGAIDLRGAVVPVIDLVALLGHGASPTPGIVMVVRVGGRVVGIGLDEICGVVELPPERMTELAVAGGEGVLQAGFVADGRSGVVLDAAALAALPGMVTAEDRLVSGRAAMTAGVPTLTFTVGGHAFGLDAAAIEATVPCQPVIPGPVADPLWIAQVVHNGRRLPVIDTLQLLGLGACPPAREMACIVVRLNGQGRVALRIDSVSDMIRLRPEAVSGLQGLRVDGDGLLSGMCQTDRPLFLIDAARLADHAGLLNLAGLAERGEGPIAAAGDHGGQTEPFLIFTLGDGPCAVPLAQVTEIVPAAAAELVELGGASRFPAMFIHRGMAVPVVDLAGGQGPGGPMPGAYILLVSDGVRHIGFWLQGLHAVERHRPRNVGRGAAASGLLAPIIRTHAGETCTVLDLAGRISDYAPQ